MAGYSLKREERSFSAIWCQWPHELIQDMELDWLFCWHRSSQRKSVFNKTFCKLQSKILESVWNQSSLTNLLSVFYSVAPLTTVVSHDFLIVISAYSCSHLAYLGTSASATLLLFPAYTGWWAVWWACTRAGASYPWYGIIIEKNFFVATFSITERYRWCLTVHVECVGNLYLEMLLAFSAGHITGCCSFNATGAGLGSQWRQ